MPRKLALIALILGSFAVGSAASAQSPFAPMMNLRTAQQRTQAQNSAPRNGTLRCAVDENGVSAPASIEVRQGTRVVASASCANAITLPAGSYTAIVTLETAIDRPTRTLSVSVPGDAEAIARASFATAILEVRFTAGGNSTSGIAIVRQGGRDIGTLGSGVPVRISAGTYDLTLRYRSTDRVMSVALSAD